MSMFEIVLGPTVDVGQPMQDYYAGNLQTLHDILRAELDARYMPPVTADDEYAAMMERYNRAYAPHDPGSLSCGGMSYSEWAAENIR